MPETTSPANDTTFSKSSRPQRSLVVSVHDVSPLTWQAVDQIINKLYLLGVPRTSLLVIPNHHRKCHILEDTGFRNWLREKVQAGHEPVIHGYYHRRRRRRWEGPVKRFLTRVYTAGEAEFYDQEFDDSLRLVARAREQFHKLGLQPEGFIAPAWLLGQQSEQALRRLHIRYTVRIESIINLVNNQVHRSRSLVYSTRAWWRRWLSLGWNAWLHKQLERKPLLRISIHPSDIEHPMIWRQIEQFLLQAQRKRRKVTTYGDFVEASSHQ